MRSWTFVALLAVACAGGGYLGAWPLLLHIGYLLIALAALALLLAVGGSRWLVVHTHMDRGTALTGEELTQIVSIENRGRLPALNIELDMADQTFALAVPPGRRTELTSLYRLPYRGRYVIGGGTVRASDPLGIARLAVARVDPATVTVYPRAIPVALPGSAAGDLDVARPRWRRGSAEATVGDLRPYVPGDPISRVHWRSTARTGTLMVTDPEPERPGSTWLLVDLGGEDPESERAPGVAAYLAAVLCSTGGEVGAVVCGRELEIVTPVSGRDGEANILEALALVPGAPSTAIHRLARSATVCGRAGALVVVTPAVVPTEAKSLLSRVCSRVWYVHAGEGLPL